jgi:hypothetical protein
VTGNGGCGSGRGGNGCGDGNFGGGSGNRGVIGSRKSGNNTKAAADNSGNIGGCTRPLGQPQVDT